MPEASETTSGNAMTADERKEWEKWQTRESKAQGTPPHGLLPSCRYRRHRGVSSS